VVVQELLEQETLQAQLQVKEIMVVLVQVLDQEKVLEEEEVLVQ
jgi:hypothetical protein